MNKTEKLLKALKGGAELSTAQIRSRFGFESDSGVSSVIRNLRSQGYSVYANTRNGVTKYRIGTAPRVAVATAFAVHGSEIFTR